MTAEALKSLKIWITTGITIGGGIFASYEGYLKVSENIDKAVKEKVEQYSKPIINAKIKSTLDSVMSARQVSFRETLGNEIGVAKEDVVEVIADWYLSERKEIKVGLYYNVESGRLHYIDVDGERYRPFPLDSLDAFYFIDHNHRRRWCK